MPVLAPAVLRDYITRVFAAAGVPDDDAATVAQHLVEANQYGHDSHGVIRVERYVSDIAGGIGVPLRGSGGDFYRIRPHQTGDGARHVDWKSSAHTGTLMVREFAAEDRGKAEIWLERSVPAGQRADFEKTVSQCAYLAWTLARHDVPFRLRSDGFFCRVPEEGPVFIALRYLALVEPLPGAPAAAPEAAEDASAAWVVFRADAPFPGQYNRRDS